MLNSTILISMNSMYTINQYILIIIINSIPQNSCIHPQPISYNILLHFSLRYIYTYTSHPLSHTYSILNHHMYMYYSIQINSLAILSYNIHYHSTFPLSIIHCIYTNYSICNYIPYSHSIIILPFLSNQVLYLSHNLSILSLHLITITTILSSII